MGGLVISGQMFFLMEYTWQPFLHGATAYVAMAIGIPVALAMVSRASQHRWAATIAASVYMIYIIAEILILPLFPAQPKLGPVYFPVTHMVPSNFPILVVAPALVLDLLWKRTRNWRSWQVALLSGVSFVVVLVAVEWPFASFLMTPAAANRFFGTIYFDYGEPSWGFDRLRQFWEPGHGIALFRGLAIAAICGTISTWIGLGFGGWMRGRSSVETAPRRLLLSLACSALRFGACGQQRRIPAGHGRPVQAICNCADAKCNSGHRQRRDTLNGGQGDSFADRAAAPRGRGVAASADTGCNEDLYPVDPNFASRAAYG